MSKKRKNYKPEYSEYSVRSFAKGLIILTLVNVFLALGMRSVFGGVGVIGIFFLVENIFFNTLFVNQNTKNIIYLKKELDKLKKEQKKKKKT